MRNARILNSILGIDEQKSMVVRLAFSYLDNQEEKYITTPNIKLTSFNDIITLLNIAEAQSWESIIGKVVQIELDNDNLVSVANIFDKNINVNFLNENEIQEDIEDNKDIIEE